MVSTDGPGRPSGRGNRRTSTTYHRHLVVEHTDRRTKEERAHRYLVIGFFSVFVPALVLIPTLVVYSFLNPAGDPSNDITSPILAAEAGAPWALDDLAPLTASERNDVARVATEAAQVDVLQWLNNTGGYEPQTLVRYVFEPTASGLPEAERRIRTAEQLRADGADLCAPLPDDAFRRSAVGDTEALARLTSDELADWFIATC